MSFTKILFGLSAALGVLLTAAAGHASAQATIDTSKPYRIMCQFDLKVLDVPGFSTRLGEQIQQYTSNLGRNQMWYFEHVGSGQYVIRSASSGMVLDVPDNGAQGPGRIIQQYRRHAGPNQRWTLVPAGDGSYYIRSVWTRGVLDVPGFDVRDGVKIQQYPLNRGSNQRFYLVPVTR